VLARGRRYRGRSSRGPGQRWRPGPFGSIDLIRGAGRLPKRPPSASGAGGPLGGMGRTGVRIGARAPRFGWNRYRTSPQRSGWIRDRGALNKGCYRGAGDGGRVHNLGISAPADGLSGHGRQRGRLPAHGTRSNSGPDGAQHSRRFHRIGGGGIRKLGPIGLALVKLHGAGRGEVAGRGAVCADPEVVVPPTPGANVPGQARRRTENRSEILPTEGGPRRARGS